MKNPTSSALGRPELTKDDHIFQPCLVSGVTVLLSQENLFEATLQARRVECPLQGGQGALMSDSFHHNIPQQGLLPHPFSLIPCSLLLPLLSSLSLNTILPSSFHSLPLTPWSPFSISLLNRVSLLSQLTQLYTRLPLSQPSTNLLSLPLPLLN